MPAEPARLPVTVALAPGEAIDGYLERLAAANGMPRPQLARRLRSGGAKTTFLTIAPDPEVVANVAALSTVDDAKVRAGTLASLPGVDATGLDPSARATWRTVAARGWPPEHGSALCPGCMAEDGVWRLGWRHPWFTACSRHEVWLLSVCPSCGRRFRSHRTPLRPVDAPTGTCGNPVRIRGRNCPQALTELRGESTPTEVLIVQRRIDAAIAGNKVAVLGTLVDPGTYLGELKALTVLLLHLAAQPGADSVAAWAPRAREDRARSVGDGGARWGIAPPANLVLRGSAIATAGGILHQPALNAAAEALHPWTELTPVCAGGQLGWLADRTTMTPTLTRLVMAGTATRRRIATLLDRPPAARLPSRAIPQVLPADLYETHLAGMLDVTDRTGRLFASLCLARRHAGARTWAEAATALGLLAETGVKTARACSADLLVRPDILVKALDDLARQLDLAVEYRAREAAVRRLAGSATWYRRWARNHRPGSHDSSRGYAVTWLWTEYAHGHLDTSPAWLRTPDHLDRARFRRYTGRLTAAAKDTLIVHAGCATPGGRRTA